VSDLEVFLSCLFEDLVVEGQVGNSSLETYVLRLELLETLYLVDP
jgi:hypothetical protein